MQVADQLRHFGIHIDQALGEFIGVARGVADALYARNVGYQLN